MKAIVQHEFGSADVLELQDTTLVSSPFVGQKLRAFISRETKDDLLALKELVEAGRLTPVIDRTYPLAETADAIRHIAEGHARGKVVVTL